MAWTWLKHVFWMAWTWLIPLVSMIISNPTLFIALFVMYKIQIWWSRWLKRQKLVIEELT